MDTAAAGELGGIDMLFSNAGAMAQGGDPASWEQNFRLDVLGAVNAFEAARPFLEASGARTATPPHDHFIGVGSRRRQHQLLRPHQGGVDPHGKGTCAAIRIEENPRQRGVARHGLFRGRLWHKRELELPKVFQGALDRNPLGRMATPQDVANAAVFLASPASSFTTGSNLIVDGAISNRVNF